MTFADRYMEAAALYVGDPSEEALSAAYEVGRSAVRDGLSVLDVAVAHQEAAVAVVAACSSVREAAEASEAVGAFFVEAVSAWEMVQRVLRDAQEAAEAERRQSAVLRRLSMFLGDPSIAADDASTMEEMLQLVAEHAREVLAAARCVVRASPEGETPLEVTAADESSGETSGTCGNGRSPGWLATPLCTLDGRALGLIEVHAHDGGEFSELDEALLEQLAQMASAAIERAQLYRR